MLRPSVSPNTDAKKDDVDAKSDCSIELEQKLDPSMIDMLNLISTLQSDRMNNQRAELRPLQPDDTKGASLPGQNASATMRIKPEEDFLEIIARVQGSRLEDQRTELPRPQPSTAPVKDAIQKSDSALDEPKERETETPALTQAGIQRPGPGQPQAHAAAGAEAPPARAAREEAEQDAFFAQLMRAQSSRLEDQRATIGGASKKN